MDGTFTWGTVEKAQPRALDTTMYLDAVSKLGVNELLMLKVEQTVQGTIRARRRICYPYRRIFAYWIPSVERCNQIMSQVKASDTEIIGYYGVDKDDLLRILFSD